MAAKNAIIGALRVSLGLDTAQFETGLKNAQSGLQRFSKIATVGMAAVAAGAVAAGAGLALVVKGAIDHADEISKAAQKTGLSVEALSRLEYAAKLSDVSLESLSTGLGKLSQNMANVASGAKGPAANAFKALGISVTDAQGQLRSSGDVLGDLADRFSRMPDGARKTALAMAVLGKAGASMIPLLNGGRKELERLAAVSDSTGQTLSTEAAHGAEAFNDSITALQGVMSGLVNKLMTAVLPSLNNLITTLQSPKFAKAIEDIATTIVDGMNSAMKAVSSVNPEVIKLGGALAGALILLGPIAGGLGGLTTVVTTLTPAIIGLTTSVVSLGIALLALPGAAAIAAAAVAAIVLLPTEVGKGEDAAVAELNAKWMQARDAKTRLAKLLAGPLPAPTGVYDGMLGKDGKINKITPTTPPPFVPPIIDDAAGAAAEKAKAAYDRLVASANERIAQSHVEAQALGMTEEAANRLRYATDLLADATKNGTKLTEPQRAELNALADSMAAAEEQTRQLSEVYDLGQQTMGLFFSDLKGELVSGASLWGGLADAAGKALDSIADKALSMAANGIWDMIFNAGGGSSGTGIISGIASLFHFANGTDNAPGGWSVVGEEGPELMNVKKGAQIIPNDKIGLGGGAPVFNISVDARGATPGAATEIVKQLKTKLPAMLRDASRRGALA